MSVIRNKVADIDGKEVYEYVLENGYGLSAHILNYGGIIKKLIYKGIDVVLGRETIDEYLHNEGAFGALIGRNSNRIENSEFELNGKTYKLCSNFGRNNLHGGKIGFDKKVWDSRSVDEKEPSLILTLISPDMDEGFPGKVDITVTYTLTVDNGLKIHYEGYSDADTILNMTNHSYFNLNGHSSGSALEHSLWVNCDFYTPNTDECIPTGEVLSVKETPFDFKINKTFAERFETKHHQIMMFGGFDHNVVLNGRGFRKVACLTGDKSKILMEVHTNSIGMQIYTGNWMDKNRVYKDNALYKKYCGVCLETQLFPNYMKYSHFPSGVLRKGEKYDTMTEYKFRKSN